MLKTLLPKRFLLLNNFAIIYLLLSFLIRLTFYIFSFSELSFNLISFLKMFGIGLMFDLGSLSYILVFYAIYLLLIPVKFYGCKADKILTNVGFFIVLFFILFSFLAEISFWQEYQKRYNFIAVDYLLYTYEVIENIHQSFPLPLLIGLLIVFVFIIKKGIRKKGVFKHFYQNKNNFKQKLIPTLFWCSLFLLFHFNVKNTDAEIFKNRYRNEIAKSGNYSFFAAYKSNELNYNEFYLKNSEDTSISLLQELIKTPKDSFLTKTTLKRYIKSDGVPLKPNVIFIGLESLNASFMTRFDNQKNQVPTLDSLVNASIFFNNLYATGTRTIRGIEALTLSIPPTPGRSIVKRKGHKNLFTIGEVFKQKGYSRTFFYGGDGYFDNMNSYFSYNGFDIVDRKKTHRLSENSPTRRTRIEDNEVTFENAWAVSDLDLFNKVLDYTDKQAEKEKPFFNFVMTSSNHQPYTYPNGFVDIPSGTNREGALRYADYSLNQFFKMAKKKSWYKNTVFVLVSDHCAYSAGRTELNMEKYHIPAFIINLPNKQPEEINTLISQIDIFPTLFGYLNWSYTSNFFGRDIREIDANEERALIANYRKLGLLKPSKLSIINSEQKSSSYNYNSNKKRNTLISTKTDSVLLKENISYYQGAFNLFKNGLLKLK
tara:strand:+ start:4078 stop:6042 length:1965 start_codon:yes stop_codon:yes gene_type:complete